jgi:peptidoglycan/LPS O-acetylase OafA/YrhL
VRRDSERLFSLDVLRGIAVTLVLIRHIPTKPLADEHVTNALFEMGWTGVDLFFVLSGFLISGLLYTEASRSGEIQFKRFWLRRGMKIWPAYYAVYGLLVVAKLGEAVLRHKAKHLGWIPPNLVFVQNYFPAEQRWPHSWSLAIEEHFYLALPLVMIVLLRREKSLRALPWIAAAVCVTTLAARVYFASQPGWAWDDFYYPTHFRADSLMFGVLLGFAYHHHRAWFDRVARAWPLLLAGMAGVLAMAAAYPLEDGSSTVPYSFGFTLLYLGFGGAVVCAGAYPSAGVRNPVARALAWMGVYSYTIYLCHSVVMRFPGADRLPMFIRNHGLDSPWVDRVTFWILSIGAGYLASHAIERPFLALRSKWLPMSGRERPTPLAAAAP